MNSRAVLTHVITEEIVTVEYLKIHLLENALKKIC